MKKYLLSALVVLCACVYGQATLRAANLTAYTTQADFQNALATPFGSYQTDLDGISKGQASAIPFSDEGYGFTVAAETAGSNTLYVGEVGGSVPPKFASPFAATDDLLVNAFSSGVLAFGANFFVTNINEAQEFQQLTVEFTFGDTTTELRTFTATSQSDAFWGLVSDSPITLVTLQSPGSSNYATINNMVAGVPVPEPATYMGLLTAAAGLLAGNVMRRRRRSGEPIPRSKSLPWAQPAKASQTDL
jgi:hypothetical protein